MEIKHKRFILSVVILSVVAGTVTFVYQKKYPMVSESVSDLKNMNRIPDFAMGTVVRVENDKLILKGSFVNDTELELTGSITKTTKITRQTQIRGLATTEVINKEEVNEGDTVVVYYSDRSENTITLDKIQVLD